MIKKEKIRIQSKGYLQLLEEGKIHKYILIQCSEVVVLHADQGNLCEVVKRVMVELSEIIVEEVEVCDAWQRIKGIRVNQLQLAGNKRQQSKLL